MKSLKNSFAACEPNCSHQRDDVARPAEDAPGASYDRRFQGAVCRWLLIFRSFILDQQA
jgi:hypothetical protein